MHTADGVADRFLSDVEEELAIIMKDPSKPVEGKVSSYPSQHTYLTTYILTPFKDLHVLPFINFRLFILHFY
jgi:hypothetical protein